MNAAARVTIVAAGPDGLRAYARIPIAFEVSSVFRVDALEPGALGFRLIKEHLPKPWIKDYDRYAGPDGAVKHWASSFNLTKWGFFIAWAGEEPVGGCTVAIDTPELHMLEGRRDLAVLWDLRVVPERRQQGIGRRLFRRACDWARKQGCRRLKIETQNVNVPACRFYARQGCVLGGINRFHYPGDEQAETMLLWYLELPARPLVSRN